MVPMEAPGREAYLQKDSTLVFPLQLPKEGLYPVLTLGVLILVGLT